MLFQDLCGFLAISRPSMSSMDTSLLIIECLGNQGFKESHAAKDLCRATRSDEKICISSKRLYTSRTPLMFAAYKGDLARLRYLLRLDFPIDQQCSRGFSALFWAISGGCIECVRFLISEGANKYLICKRYFSPLLLAIALQRFDIVRLLIDSGLISFQGSLNLALLCGHTDLALYLLKAGATFDCINVSASRKKKRDSTLMWIIKNTAPKGGAEQSLSTTFSEFFPGPLGSDAESIKEYINYTRSDGTSPLMLACFYNHCEAVKILLELGAQNSIRPRDDLGPMLWAARRANCEAIDLLMLNGFDLNVRTASGHGALKYAIEANNVNFVLWLCAKGINIQFSLSLILENYVLNAIEIAKILLYYGAQPALEDVETFLIHDPIYIELFLDYGYIEPEMIIGDRSLLQISIARQHHDLMHCLLRKLKFSDSLAYEGCLEALIKRPDCFDSEGPLQNLLEMLCERADQEERTRAFHCAIYEEKPKLIQCICFYGADIDKKMCNGLYPLMMACTLNNSDLVKQLVGLGLSDIHNFYYARTRKTYSSVSMFCDKADIRGMECLETLKSFGFQVV